MDTSIVVVSIITARYMMLCMKKAEKQHMLTLDVAQYWWCNFLMSLQHTEWLINSVNHSLHSVGGGGGGQPCCHLEPYEWDGLVKKNKARFCEGQVGMDPGAKGVKAEVPRSDRSWQFRDITCSPCSKNCLVSWMSRIAPLNILGQNKI